MTFTHNLVQKIQSIQRTLLDRTNENIKSFVQTFIWVSVLLLFLLQGWYILIAIRAIKRDLALCFYSYCLLNPVIIQTNAYVWNNVKETFETGILAKAIHLVQQPLRLMI